MFAAPEPKRGRFVLFSGIGIAIVVVVCLCLVVAGVLIASGAGWLGSGDFFDTTGGGSIAIGESVSGTIGSNIEAHNWLFEGAEGQVVEIFVVGDGISDPRARLIGPDDSVVARADDSGDSVDVFIIASLPETGTYTIRIDMFDPGGYTLTLSG